MVLDRFGLAEPLALVSGAIAADFSTLGRRTLRVAGDVVDHGRLTLLATALHE